MKSIHSLLVFVLTLCSVITLAQNSTVSWERQSVVGGLDFYTDIIEDKNGGYAVIGSKNVKGNSLDFWMVRYDENGDTIWTKTIGTKHKDIAEKITQLSDNSYLVMGSLHNEGSVKVFLAKLNNEGAEQWRKFFEDDLFIVAEDLISLEDGSFAIVGGKGADSEKSNIWMATLNTNGDIIWEKTYKDELWGCAKSINKLPDGGFAIAGQVSNTGKNDCDIIALRTNDEGTALWFSRIKTPGQKVWPKCICCSPDSCFMIVGWKGKCMNDINSSDPVFDFDVVLNKIGCDGEILWTKNFDREGSEGGNAVTIRPDGNFIIAGIKATSFLGKVGPWLLQTDNEGNELSEKLLRFRFNNDHAIKIINCSDGGFVVIGPGIQDETNTRSNGWIMKFASM